MRSHSGFPAGLLVAFVAGGLVLAASIAPAFAAAMSCSTEQTSCLQVCRAANAKLPASACINDCASRHSTCMHTGCWNNGKLNYCGLLRK